MNAGPLILLHLWHAGGFWNKHSNIEPCVGMIHTTHLAGRNLGEDIGVTVLQPGKHIVPSMLCQNYIDQCCEISPVCQSFSLELLPKMLWKGACRLKLQNHSQMNKPGGTFMSKQHGSRDPICLTPGPNLAALSPFHLMV